MASSAFPAATADAPWGELLHSGLSGKQPLTPRGAQQDLKRSEGSKLEVASEKIGSHPGQLHQPPQILLCAACDPQVQLILLFQDTLIMERVSKGQEVEEEEAGVRIRVVSFWVPSAYNCICSELISRHF